MPKKIVEFTKCFKLYKNFKRAIMTFHSKFIKKMKFNNSSLIELKKARMREWTRAHASRARVLRASFELDFELQ